MNSNATNKTRTGPKRVRTQEPEEEQETKFANESRQKCSQTGSCVAPYKPTTTSPPFRPSNHYRPLQTICQKVNHATNGRGHKIYSALYTYDFTSLVKPSSEGTTTYNPKIYIHSTWTPPHWTIPPIAL